MANVEAAIVVPRSLLEDADEIAQDLSISRDQLMDLALSEFIHRHQIRHRLTIEAVNAVYADDPDSEDKRLLKGMRRLHQQVLETNE